MNSGILIVVLIGNSYKGHTVNQRDREFTLEKTMVKLCRRIGSAYLLASVGLTEDAATCWCFF